MKRAEATLEEHVAMWNEQPNAIRAMCDVQSTNKNKNNPKPTIKSKTNKKRTLQDKKSICEVKWNLSFIFIQNLNPKQHLCLPT